jgi:ATP-dependent DNA helicase RecG
MSCLASPEEQVVEYLRSHDRINNSTGRKLLNIDSESKMKKVFERLIAAGEIEHFPGTAGRGYAYRLR